VHKVVSFVVACHLLLMTVLSVALETAKEHRQANKHVSRQAGNCYATLHLQIAAQHMQNVMSGNWTAMCDGRYTVTFHESHSKRHATAGWPI